MWTLLPSLCLFAFITAFTPGPNNFLLASSGSQFGLRRTWHHILGIRIGVSGLILLSAAGVGVLVQAYPLAYSALKYFGFIYMSWLAIKLILAGGNLNKSHATQPLTLVQAALFQLGNVKAWAASLTVVATYTLPSLYWVSVVWILAAFTVTGLVCNLCWAGMGKAASLYLDTPRKIRTFNYSLSGMTFATILPVLFQA